MKPSVFIDSYTTDAASALPAAMDIAVLDIGRDITVAKLRLPIADEGYVPESQWCKRELTALVPRLRGREQVAMAMVEIEDGVTMDIIIREIEHGLASPDGISTHFRGWTR